MAKSSKKDTIPYLGSYVPDSERKYRSIQWSFGGLDRREHVDSGMFTDMMNMSVAEIPALVPHSVPSFVTGSYTNPISLFASGDFLLVIYRDGGAIRADYIKGANTYRGTIKASGATAADEVPRSIVQFNVYTTPNDPLSGTFNRKILIFPDKVSINYDISANFTPANLDAPTYPIPKLRYVTVFGSRLFGVDDDRIYASGFNDYTNWNLDTAEESLASNAWVTTAQSNTKADGAFTGITTYDGHVVCFKKDYTHQVNNTKNPFRVADIFQSGSIDNRTIHDVNGKLIYVSHDNVHMFTGGYPKNIGDALNISDYSGAVCGGYEDTYYLYHDGRIYTFDTISGLWGCMRCDSPVLNFASNNNGFYALHKDGTVKKYITNTYEKWYAETDLMALGLVDIRRIKKLSLMCDIANGARVKVYLLKEYEEFDESTSQLVLDSIGNSGHGPPRGNRLLRGLVRMASAYAHRLYITGSGYVKIYSSEIQYSYGGDLYVSE